MKPRQLALVSAGLQETGGGAAALGRMLARAMARWAEQHGHGFEIFHLGSAEGVPELPAVPIRHFGGSPARLALALTKAQATRPNLRLVFDHPGPARVQGWLPQWQRRPYLVWLLGVEVWKPLHGDRFRALERAQARLAISEATAWCAAKANPLLPGLAVVWLGLGEPSTSSIPSTPSTKSILTVGRLDPTERYKGHDELLEAFPAVLARVPHARLVVVGGGADRGRLEDKARALGLADHVTFTGYLPAAELPKLYAQSTGFALPSRGEGFGLVYLEAMAAGKPVLALTGTAAQEIVLDGETGWLVPPKDPAALTAALIAMLADPEEARRRGEAGRRRYEALFTFEAFEGRVGVWLGRLVG
ncbi:MAG: glycosyltransferase [Thermoanaerobaculia bacterium]|nr:glycosyltransferase [Thermoanaerobaculia bacterium]